MDKTMQERAQALELWRMGFDTVRIAEQMGVSEAIAESVLWAARMDKFNQHKRIALALAQKRRLEVLVVPPWVPSEDHARYRDMTAKRGEESAARFVRNKLAFARARAVAKRTAARP